MHPTAIRTIVTHMARGLAFFLVIFLPLGFAALSYRTAVSDADELALRHADKIIKYAFLHDTMWAYHGSRLADMIELPPSERLIYRQKITDADGRVIISEPHVLAWPSIVRNRPLVMAGKSIGNLRIETSLRQLFSEFLGVVVIAVALAGAVLVAFHTLPLRLIDRMLVSLATEESRTAQVLEDLAGAEQRLRERTDQLVEAQEIGRIGDWSLTVGEKHLFLSPVALAILRLDPDRFEPRRSAIAGLLVGDGALRAEALLNDVIANDQSRHIDLQFRRGDGTIADIEVTCRIAERRDGKVHRMAGTIHDVSERAQAKRELERLAYFDPLTGLPNRAMFQARLEQDVALARDTTMASALLLIDLDRFKEVNDTLGHAAGDDLLVKVSQLLRRTVDNDHFIARLGGDEFAVIMSGVAEAETIETVAREIVAVLRRSFQLNNVEVLIGASIGIALMPQHGATGEEVNMNADLALYRAKDDGRGRFKMFEPEMNVAIQHKMALARDLRAAAVANEGLEVWLQPQVHLAGGAVTGFEALMRWTHPVHGSVPPSEFIPIAESSSLICDLGLWILRESVQIAKNWIDAGGVPFEIAVNLSAAQIWQTRIEEDVAAILEESGLPAHLLCLELTETMLADHAEGRVRATLQALKGLGVRLALDDFGTGYSSLGYLIQLPFDKLKIDRIFVAEAAMSEKGRHVLEGIIALGHGLGMSVVAEGVETQAELEQLARFGCNEIQGYLVARPQPAPAALAFALQAMMRQRKSAGVLPLAAVRQIGR